MYTTTLPTFGTITFESIIHHGAIILLIILLVMVVIVARFQPRNVAPYIVIPITTLACGAFAFIGTNFSLARIVGGVIIGAVAAIFYMLIGVVTEPYMPPEDSSDSSPHEEGLYDSRGNKIYERKR